MAHRRGDTDKAKEDDKLEKADRGQKGTFDHGRDSPRENVPLVQDEAGDTDPEESTSNTGPRLSR